MYKMKLGLSLFAILVSTQALAEMAKKQDTMQSQGAYYMSSSSSYSSTTMHDGKTAHQGEISVNNVVTSKYDFTTTVARLEKAFANKDMMIFSRIDHQKAAKEKGLDMQPAVVLVFGNPKVGTPHMQKDPLFALELPLKVLVTQTQDGVMVVFKSTQSLIQNSKVSYQDVADNLAKVEMLITKTVTQ